MILYLLQLNTINVKLLYKCIYIIDNIYYYNNYNLCCKQNYLYKKLNKSYKFLIYILLNLFYFLNNKYLFIYENFQYIWFKYLIKNSILNLCIIYNNVNKYLYYFKFHKKLNIFKNTYYINNNLIHNYILYKNNFLIYFNHNFYKYNFLSNLKLTQNNNLNLYNNLLYNSSIININNNLLTDITIGLQMINNIMENKVMSITIPFISNNIYVIFYITYYNYLNHIIYIYNMYNKITNYIYKYQFNTYTYIFENISSILYSGYSLITNCYTININLQYYYKYLYKTINNYQAIKSAYIYIYNIILESLIKQYNYQNIYLPSIYFELIIKKMLSCIQIKSNNFQLFKYNDIIPLYLINFINYSLKINFYQIYKYEPYILGITKSILATSGLLTNMSFQNTLKIISLNILNNKIDWLIDIKSKIIMTDLLPIGNGWYRYFTT